MGAREAADRVPPEKREPVQAPAPEPGTVGNFKPPTILPPPLTFPAPEEEPVVAFPQIEGAAQDLASRRLLTQEEFNLLDAQARETAFTVARVASLDALEKIRDALVVDIAEGGTLRQFAGKVDDILGTSALSPAHVENVYRTNVAQAYSAAQKDILNHPLIGDEFPYAEYHAVHDSRTEPEHLELEKLGIQGTNIYRRDDPVIQLFWPPWRWNCRCACIPLTLEMAARKGIREAVEWMRTGVPPASPAWVQMPSFRPPTGWDRGTVQLSTDWQEAEHPRDAEGRWRSAGTGATKADVEASREALVARLRELAGSDNMNLKERQWLGLVKHFYPGVLPEKTAIAHVFYDPAVADIDAVADTEGRTVRLGPKAFGNKGSSGSLGDTFVHELEHLHDEHSGHKRTEYTPRLRQMLRELDDPRDAMQFLRKHGRDEAEYHVDNWFTSHPGHEMNEEEKRFAVEELLRRAKQVYQASLVPV